MTLMPAATCVLPPSPRAALLCARCGVGLLVLAARLIVTAWLWVPILVWS